MDIKTLIKTHENILILFYADWCGHCSLIKPSLKKFVSLKDFHYIEIDSDKENKLQQLFNIEFLPTLIVINKGKKIKLEGINKIKKFINGE